MQPCTPAFGSPWRSDVQILFDRLKPDGLEPPDCAIAPVAQQAADALPATATARATGVIVVDGERQRRRQIWASANGAGIPLCFQSRCKLGIRESIDGSQMGSSFPSGDLHFGNRILATLPLVFGEAPQAPGVPICRGLSPALRTKAIGRDPSHAGVRCSPCPRRRRSTRSAFLGCQRRAAVSVLSSTRRRSVVEESRVVPDTQAAHFGGIGAVVNVTDHASSIARKEL
jgi:hypothetical protein